MLHVSTRPSLLVNSIQVAQLVCRAMYVCAYSMHDDNSMCVFRTWVDFTVHLDLLQILYVHSLSCLVMSDSRNNCT